MDGADFLFYDGHVKWLKVPDALTGNNNYLLKTTVAH